MVIEFIPYAKRRLEGLIPPGVGEYIYGQTGKANKVYDKTIDEFVLCVVSKRAKVYSEIYPFEICKYIHWKLLSFFSPTKDNVLIHELLYELTEVVIHELSHQIDLANRADLNTKEDIYSEDEIRVMAEIVICEMREMRVFGRKPKMRGKIR